MPSFFARDKRTAAVVALALATMAATGLMPAPGGRRQIPQPTPLQLFQKMLPVIRHPRCLNCHGGIDPHSSKHKGGIITTESCDGCHDEADVNAKFDDWELPRPEHFFVGKTDRDLCGLFANFASRMGRPKFISNHIQGDTLIGLAFVGLIGGARTPGRGTPPDPPADPPPMSRTTFINLAKDWLNRGQGACDVQGTITEEESVTTDTAWTLAPGIDERLQQDGTRSVIITLSGGQYRAQIHLQGKIIITQIHHSHDASGRPCTVTTRATTTYAGSTTGIASVQVKDTMLFADTQAPQRDYRIDVTLPPEHTTQADSTTIADLCGTGLTSPPPDMQQFDWDDTKVILEGHLEDPTDFNYVGACDKTIKSTQVGSQAFETDNAKPCNRFANVGNAEEPFLMHHVAASAYHDGTDIPFRVVTTWNIAYHK